jgi:phasin
MTEVTTAAAKSNTAKPAVRAFGAPNYEIPKLDLPNMEVPEAVREIAEKGVAQAKDTCQKAKVAAEQATDLLKDTYATAAKGATDYNLKIVEIARTNINTAFECAQELMGVKSPSEFVALSTAHVRKQFDTMIAQTKELAELAQNAATEITEPLKAGVTKAFNNKVA